MNNIIISDKQSTHIKESLIKEFLDKKWGVPLKNALLDWVDDYIEEF